MANKLTYASMLALLLAVFVYLYGNSSILRKCQMETCPYCFGITYCYPFEHGVVKVRVDSFERVFNNYLSAKNVFSVNLNDEDVILKKLGDTQEFLELDKLICSKRNLSDDCQVGPLGNLGNDYEKAIREFLLDNSKARLHKLKICSADIAEELVEFYVAKVECKDRHVCLQNLWTILQINPEPLLLMLFEDFKVPKYLGPCGRLVVVEDAGFNLNKVADFDFYERLFVAYQIVEGVTLFTENHPDYRLYLTDVSPDNIAVDSELNVKFVDLENVILTKKHNKSKVVHHSEDLSEHSFAYSEEKICRSQISDNNYYATCKLLLSKSAPWPMMKGGLLHSPPEEVLTNYGQLFDAIENCALGTVNRFEAIGYILDKMYNMLEETLD